MEGNKISEKVSAIKEDKAKMEQPNKERKSMQQEQIEAYFKCKENLHVARMFVLQEYLFCHNV